MNKEINNTIKINNIIVEKINQILHNEGIEFSQRLDIIINILNYKFNKIALTININEKIKSQLVTIIDELSINKSEIYQKIFMFYGNKKTKINLDQYYTPITIGDFINSLCIPGKKHIDPACGSGDLIISYNGKLTLWDISPDIVEICKLNYNLQQKKYTIRCINSIKNFDEGNNVYDYCSLNPPFGSSTVISDKDILSEYELGKGKKKKK